MKKLFFGMSMVMLGIANAWSSAPKDLYVIPVKNDIPVFAHDPKTAAEQPAFVVGTGDRLMVLGADPDAFKVSDLRGDVGWIGKASVRDVGPSKTMTFDNADVLGYLDNPTPIYILDATDSMNGNIKLDRSFSQELKENLDQVTADRIVGETPARF